MEGIRLWVVIYLAALTGINSEYYEAARLTAPINGRRSVGLPFRPQTDDDNCDAVCGRQHMKGQFELFYQVIGTNSSIFHNRYH